VKSAATKDPDSVKKYVDSLADSKGFVKRTTLITLLKVFGLYKPTGDAERVLRRLAPNPDGLIPKAALVDFFEKEARYERGKLTEEDIGKVFDSFSREGVLTFAILMKNAEELANKIGEKDAKLMVKIMGHGKDHITKADFIKALTRK
jgi:Ca2+-binding EF-hand superfamily protein